MDEAVRDRVVEKCPSSKLRRRLLREAHLTLTNCLQIAKQFQASERDATQMEMHARSSTSQSQETASTLVLLMHIVYKVHIQGVITNRLQVALFYQSVFVVGCWATKLKIRLVPQKEKLGANVVNRDILEGYASLRQI